MAVTMRRRSMYYGNTEDVVTTVAQCADYISEHCAELLGGVVEEDIHTSGLEVIISIQADKMPTIMVNKDVIYRPEVPFSGD